MELIVILVIFFFIMAVCGAFDEEKPKRQEVVYYLQLETPEQLDEDTAYIYAKARYIQAQKILQLEEADLAAAQRFIRDNNIKTIEYRK